jgi:hypothetical protein
MRTRNIDYQNDIEIIKKQNNDIENQSKQLRWLFFFFFKTQANTQMSEYATL